MAFINYTTNNLAIKIVYYGPGLSGKTTNLRHMYYYMHAASRGELICLETDTERTMFFDLLPIKAGLIKNFRIHVQLMTVPGQVFYEASRKSILKGADGLVFVADSQAALLDANIESFDGLRQNLLEHNMDINFIPLVFQYNKRDLNNLIPVETFNNLLNPRKVPFIESSAINGVGVFETLKEISKLTVPHVRKKVFKENGEEEEIEGRMEETQEKKEENIEFVSSPSSIQPKKIKIKSQKDIEKELESLVREFTNKEKY